MDAKLVDAVRAVLAAAEGEVGRTRLVKLLFLADLQARSELGHSISGVDYSYHYYGPYADPIIDAVEELARRGEVVTSRRPLPNGSYFTGYSVHRPPANGACGLAPDEQLIVDEVVDRWGDRSLQELLAHVYSLPTMRAATPGRPIDLQPA